MTTTHLTWQPSSHFDIHLLRGRTSRRLDNVLVLNQHDGTTSSPLAPPPDVRRVEFLPRLRAPAPAPDPAPEPGADPNDLVVIAHGVKVNIRTGRVTALDPPPARAVANLLIEATVTVENATGAPRVLPVIRIRIHVHRSITDAWLTPSPLSIRENSPGQRLSVLAQFDDQTIGDVTTHPGISWLSASPSVTILNEASGALAGTVSLAAQVIASLPDDLGGVIAEGEVQVLGRWNDLPSDLRAAHLVAGSPGSSLPPGDARLPAGPNVLFISEGFVGGDRPVFEQAVAEVVRLLRTSPGTSPFNLLRDSVNYWSVFVPSPGPRGGVTTLYELDLVSRGSKLVGQEVPLPLPATAGIPADIDERLQELVLKVGLPVPADVTGDADADFVRKRTDWAELFGVNPDQIDRRIFGLWRKLHDRRLGNERDTALGLKIGERPAVEQDSPPRSIGLNPMRTARAQLDQFLATVTDGPGGPRIGATWDSRTSPRGKDHNLVIALCGGARNSGMTQRGFLVSTGLVDPTEVPLQAVPGGRRVEVLPHPVPRSGSGGVRIVKDAQATVAHETAHALLIGDEYGGTGDLPASKLADVRLQRNLQPLEDAEITDEDGNRLLVGDRVKWRWPKLQLAGRVIGGTFDEGGGLFSVVLAAGHVRSFAIGDTVHLRKPLPDGTARDGTSNPLAIVDQDGDRLVLEIQGGTLTAADFPAGSVLCLPVPARPSARAAGDTHAELLDQAVRDYLDTKNLPLNRAPASPPPSCAPDPRDVQRPGHLPTNLARGRPRLRAQIIGLYDGGDEHDCGVLHPTGRCIMRALLTRDARTIIGFCHVCQYSIVDQLDPSQHAALTKLFRNKDAQP